MATSAVSPLGPLSVDPGDGLDGENVSETEKTAPWVVRKLVGVSTIPPSPAFLLTRRCKSMTGRIVRSSYESLRAAGTTVICLSPVRENDQSSIPRITVDPAPSDRFPLSVPSGETGPRLCFHVSDSEI